MQVLEELSKPRDGSGSESKLSVFRFRARARHSFLFLRTPGHKVGTKENTIPASGLAIIGISCIIRVGKGSEGERSGFIHKAMIRSGLQIAKYSLNCNPVCCGWFMHELENLVDRKCNIRTSEREILECPDHTPELSDICEAVRHHVS